nr:uncharacterized protein LOC109164936 isoform X2 [Ipomoea trifida]
MRALPPPPSGRSAAAEMDMRYRGLLARRSSGHRKRKSEESTPKSKKPTNERDQRRWAKEEDRELSYRTAFLGSRVFFGYPSSESRKYG